MKTILCYGDSNTYGYDPSTGERYIESIRWTTILKEKLGSNFNVIVEGLNGRTTAYDRPDDPNKNGYPYLLPCISSNKPVDIINIMLGTNDCNKDLNLSVDDISKGMEKLITTIITECVDIQGFVPQIIIMAPAPILKDYTNSPFAYQLDENSIIKSESLSGAYQKLAQKYNCFFVDLKDKVEVSKIDSEHLTKKGHKEVANLLYRCLEANGLLNSERKSKTEKRRIDII